MDSDFAIEVKNLLCDVSPERKEEIAALLEGVSFHEDDNDEGIGFCAVAAWKYVRVTVSCQSRLWAHCFAYYIAFNRFSTLQNPTEKLYKVSDELLAAAGELLEWAVHTDVCLRKESRGGLDFRVPEIPIPPNLVDGQNWAFLLKAADEIFKCGMAFIVHHELAHVRLGHGVVEGDTSIEQEYEADKAAAEMLLGIDTKNEFDYLVRHLGVAIALLWFTSIFFREKYIERTHPAPWRRLLRALEPTVRADEDAIWGFVALALSLHFDRHGLPMDAHSEFAPTKATVCEMIGIIEEHNRKLGQS